MKRLPFLLFAFLLHFLVAAQKAPNLVYVDKQGVLRYTKDKSEAAFFGVNYTVPFAYGYRSHKALGVDPEKAIDADVYHMARLGLDAFRVHVWDVEISDSLGNLLNNEHLRLFDYLLKKLKDHHLKILVTPIAFWGNGYPEPDQKLPGFSSVYGKGPSVVKEEAIRAQENYLKQFFRHVNPYTGVSYKDEPDIIATEINNEPHHSGPREKATQYITRLAKAIRSTGWTKPVFYNISESPAYAGAVVKAKVDGHSFQWYPTGLVAGREQKGNFLPNVDKYRIPFADSLPAFRTRALMVYEFDAADVLQPVLYPAIARSFRTAGFQWATQFAYDPLATAYGNTEYQTHYLNLAYTPAKAISLLIASRAFHRLPRGKSWGTFPADTLFDVFRVSYREQLSEMNSGEEFYYSNTTTTQPKDVSTLKHIAGVGSSPAVKYDGSGAYFLDKVADGVWLLEIMPDATVIADPFAKASPRKTVVQVETAWRRINLLFLDPARRFRVKQADSLGDYEAGPLRSELRLRPGKYLLTETGAETTVIASPEFYLPTSHLQPALVHTPFAEVSAGRPLLLTARISGIDSVESVMVELRNSSLARWRNLPMQRRNKDECSVEIPADALAPGLLNYRVMVRRSGGDTYTFPGGFNGAPYAWDEYRNEAYQTFVAAPGSALELFNSIADRGRLNVFNPNWRASSIDYVTAEKPMQLVQVLTMQNPSAGQFLAWQLFVGDKLSGRKSELDSFTKLVIRARASQPASARLSLVTTDAAAFAANVNLSAEWRDVEIPLSSLQRDSVLLLPRPYPGFQPLEFFSGSTGPFRLADAEKLEFRVGEKENGLLRVEVESVCLKR